MDGCSSHAKNLDSLELLEEHKVRKRNRENKKKKKKVKLLVLPSHTSHILQPLDVSVFSPLKTLFRKKTGIAHLINESFESKKANFPVFVKKPWEQSLTRSNIVSGFEATGIFPNDLFKIVPQKRDVNRNLFTNLEWFDMTKPHSQDLLVDVIERYGLFTCTAIQEKCHGNSKEKEENDEISLFSKF